MLNKLKFYITTYFVAFGPALGVLIPASLLLLAYLIGANYYVLAR